MNPSAVKTETVTRRFGYVPNSIGQILFICRPKAFVLQLQNQLLTGQLQSLVA